MNPEQNPYSTDAPEQDLPPVAGGNEASDRLSRGEAEATEMKDAWLRARAELENVRKQGQADVARAHKYAIDKFAGELLPVKDALELALASPGADSPLRDSLREGVALTLKQLVAAFAKSGITEIAAAGEKFDPHRHQAMAMIDSAEAPNTIVQVFQKGYLLNDRVLRPALVAVAKAKDGGGEPAA
jgi:molecular chaperone GrpE